mmetsp:Transcript_31886/g.70851  ORF Transcript_31886/g.70851 Transcript_31886/m.70851 type:complete len:349 (-) Transcript_31886:2136-3182(-)
MVRVVQRVGHAHALVAAAVGPPARALGPHQGPALPGPLVVLPADVGQYGHEGVGGGAALVRVHGVPPAACGAALDRCSALCAREARDGEGFAQATHRRLWVQLQQLLPLVVGDPEEGLHQPLALDLHATCALPVLVGKQLGKGIADVNAACLARALHPGGGVHRVTKQRELGHLGSHQSADKRPCVDANTKRYRFAVVRHEHRLRLAKHSLGELHDPYSVRSDLVFVHLIHANKAILILLDEASNDDVAISDNVQLVHAILIHQIIEDLVQLVQEVHDLAWLHLLGHRREPNHITEQHHHLLMGVGQVSEIPADSAGHAGKHVLDDVAREQLLQHAELGISEVCQLVL